MIFKLDHIGITVPSLEEAQEQLEAFYPRTHNGQEMDTGSALRDVSVHNPARFRISLHEKPNSIGIELIEYPRLARATRAIFPWRLAPEDHAGDLRDLKSALRQQVSRGEESGTFAGILSQLSAYPGFNALVVPVEDPEAEARFWKDIRFRRIGGDDEVVILGIDSLLSPVELRYVLLFATDRTAPCYTDAEGINEIALLCSSCQTSISQFPQDVFRSSVSAFPVRGMEISLGYLRSPSGVLVELFSVRRP
jgi:hypothetical protein